MRERGRTIRTITTPEGVALPFEVADAAERIAAFAVDFLVIMVSVVALVVLAVIALSGSSGDYAFAFAVLISFFIRNFYFMAMELRWGGATLGKRRFGLRVVSRDGGPLTAEAVFARNLTRDLEVFLPLTALTMPEALFPALPGWGALVASLWLLVFALLPLFNKDRLRIGDMVAGTLVVKMPAAKLLGDVADDADIKAPGGDRPAERYVFATEDLDLYGIKELQVLEEVLRRSEYGAKDLDVLEAVAEKIIAKIGWPNDPPITDHYDFLSAFYKAQRARLEQKMLFGVRQEEKKK